MMYLGSKSFTKDLDVVVYSEEEYDAILCALDDLGFERDKPTEGMKRANLSEILKRGEYRIDLFAKSICGKLQLSDTMIARASTHFESDNVCLYSCSAEDVFLLKSITEREGDVDDCNRLLLYSPRFDWDAFIKELEVQMRFGDAVWITYVVERLMMLGIDSRFPGAFRSISKIEGEYLENWASHQIDSSCRKNPVLIVSILTSITKIILHPAPIVHAET
jgi:hypothetical protein